MTTHTDTDDVLLITVDAWRRDALEQMPQLTALTADWERRDLLTASAATNGVFPAIFASSYLDTVYDEDGSIAAGATPLSSRLDTAGYATACFSASNPFLGKWSDAFETFWNDGMNANDDTTNRAESTLQKGARFVRFQPRVRDVSVLRRAREWWDTTPGPRFLHVHLMSPHAPYYPGLRRAAKIGLARSYLSILGFAKRRERLPDLLRRHVKRLYDQCVSRLDTVLAEFLDETADDARTIVTADHGEEFHHGAFGHARLYDEVTRVPYLTNDPDLVPAAPAIRQVDLPPTVASALDVDPPTSWEGYAATYDETPPQPMQNHAHGRNREWFGVHDATQKLLEVYDDEGQLRREERYNTADDPQEQEPVGSLPDEDTFASSLASLRERHHREETDAKSVGIDDDIHDRLEQLGYR